VVLSLARDLAERGFRPVVASQSGSHALTEARRHGLEARGVDFFRSRLNPTAVRQLGALVAETAPDVIHVHGARAAFPLTFALPRSPAPPVVYTVHSYHFLGKRWPWRWLGALAERWCHGRATVSTFVCRYDHDVAIRWRLLPDGATVRQIYNGIDPADFPSPLPTDGRTVVFFGNCIHQKHPELFVETAALLAAERPTLQFRMVGGGELEEAVRALADRLGLADRLTVTGRLPREAALEAVNGAHLMLLPSRWEGAPVVLLEAMYLGLPIVCSDFPALAEFVEDGRTGLVVTERSPAAYAAAARRMLDASDLRSAVVAAARAMVERRFLRSHITDQYCRCYDDLLAVY